MNNVIDRQLSALRIVFLKLTESILARKSFKVFIIKIIGTGLAFSLHVFIARLIGVTHYGVYTYAINILNILAVLSGFGLYSSSVRFVSVYIINRDWGRLRGVIHYNLFVVLVVGTLISVFGTIGLKKYGSYLDKNLIEVLFIAILIVPLFSIIKINSATLLSLKETVKSSVLLLIMRPVGLAFIISMLYLLNSGDISSLEVIECEVMVLAGVLLVSMAWICTLLPKEIRTAAPTYESKKWLSAALPLLVVAGGSVILQRTDIIMIGSLLGLEEAGIYSAASKVSGLLAFAIAAVALVISPLISELYYTGKMSELQNLVTKSARYVFFVTLAIAVPLIVWGGFIMRIFGDEFIVAYVPLLILLAGQLLSAYFGFATVIIYLTGNERVAGSFMAVNVGSNIVLNYLFITNFGVNGAAIATAITTIIWNLFLTIYLKQKININSAIL